MYEKKVQVLLGPIMSIKTNVFDTKKQGTRDNTEDKMQTIHHY